MDTIGSGGFGAVWSARSQLDGGVVALKILHAELLHHRVTDTGPTVADRFLAEARLLQQLDHPGFVEIKAVIHEPKRALVAYAMERLIGSDLSRRKMSIDLHSLLDIFAQVSDTLEFLHSKEIIHRDVKASNIFVTKPNTRDQAPYGVKLLDFGVAKELHAQAVLANTATGTFMGSVRSMAPESFYRWEAAGSPLSGAIDQWALGVALYDCLTGKMPFDDDSMVGLITKIETEPPRPMEMHPRFGLHRVPAELEALVMCCLEKRPEDRFESMSALAMVLRHVAGELPAIGGSVTDPGLGDSTVMEGDGDAPSMLALPPDAATDAGTAPLPRRRQSLPGATTDRAALDRSATEPIGRHESNDFAYEPEIKTVPEQDAWSSESLRADDAASTVSAGSPSGQYHALTVRPGLGSDAVDDTVVDQAVEGDDRTLIDPATSPPMKLVIGVGDQDLVESIPQIRINSFEMDRAIREAGPKPAGAAAEVDTDLAHPKAKPRIVRPPLWLPFVVIAVTVLAMGVGILIGWILRGH